jgi:predicted GNAT family acetyltransferase
MTNNPAEQYIYLADQPDLLPILADWFYDEWGCGDPNSSPESMRRLLGNYLNRDQFPLTIVLLRDGEPIASASLKIQEMETHPQYLHWLGGVYVHPQYRNEGFGSQLVEYTANEAVNLNIKQLYLYTRNHEEFYTRLGWQVIERPLYEGRIAIVMRRIFSAATGKE